MLKFLLSLSILWPYGMLLLVVAGLYGQSLGFGYVWDDGSLFVENTLLRESSWSWAAVARPILPDTAYFRPLVLSTWMLEMQLFELTPLYSHAINTALHGLNACLVYGIACRVLVQSKGARVAAFFAALVFAVHPCLMEGVAWISGRFDLLATTLLLSGWMIAMAPATLGRCLLAGFFALGAMLSKEIGVLFGPLLVLLTIARHPAQPLRPTLFGLWPYMLTYGVAAALYFHLRSQALGFASYSDFGGVQMVEAVMQYEAWLRKLSFYTFITLIPFSAISPLHDMQGEMLTFRQHPISLVTSGLLFLVIGLFSLQRRTWAILWLGFYVGIFPVLGFFPIKIGEIVGAERFLYLPVAMLALGAVALFLSVRERFPQQRFTTLIGGALGGGWLVISIFVTYSVMPVWMSSLQLWSWQYYKNPTNERVRLYFLNELSLSFEPKAHERLRFEIDKIQNNNNGSLPRDVQISYSGFLLKNNDPEALLYLEGLLFNMEKGQTKNPQLYDKTYAGILVNYAQALMVFHGDLRNAREAMGRARILTPRGEEFQLIHQMIALEYLDGNREIALNLYRNNMGILSAFDLKKMNSSMQTIVNEVCLAKKWNNCAAYSKGFDMYLKLGANKPS